MITNEIADVVFGSIWALLLLTLSIAVLMRGIPRGIAAHVTVPRLVALAFIVRLVPALVLDRGASYDIESYHLVGAAVLAGHSPYPLFGWFRYPYLPAQMYISAAALFLSTAYHFPLVVLAKLPSVFADSVLAGILLVGLRRHGYAEARALTAGCLYAINPISVLVTAYHGQFDALPLFCLVLAWAWLARQDGLHYTGVGIALGCAILLKTWPLLLLPAYLCVVHCVVHERHAVMRIAFLAIAIPAVTTVIYSQLAGVPLTTIIAIVATYSGVAGLYGLSFVLALVGRETGLSLTGQHLHAVSQPFTMLALGMILFIARPRQGADLPTLASRSVLVLYALAATISAQYYMWLLPFALATPQLRGRWLGLYLAGATATLAYGYLFGDMLYTPGLLSHWPLYSAVSRFLAVAFWLIPCGWLIRDVIWLPSVKLRALFA